MRVLVTGAAGYIGRRLCTTLRHEGHEVFGVDIRGSADLICDVSRDPVPLDGFDAVVPLAAIVGAPACAADPDTAHLVNVNAAEQLADALGSQRCVYLTTDSGYPPGDAIGEDASFSPQSVYARTKAEAGRILRARGATVLRLASLFGLSAAMRDDLLLHSFVQDAVGGEIRVRSPHLRRGFVHQWDVCEVVAWALEAPEAPGRIYNVTGPDRLTKGQVAEICADVTGAKVTIDPIPESDPDLRDFWMVSALPDPPVRSIIGKIPELIQHYRVVAQRAKD